MSPIGTLRENSLHASLKQALSSDGDLQEVLLDGYYIDIVRSTGELVEIQTRSFSAIKTKLKVLLEHYPIRLVYPIAVEKWIIRLEDDLVTPIYRRKSPRKGRIEDIFYELTSFPGLIDHPNLTIEILLTRQEELLCRDGVPGVLKKKISWRRRGWQVYDRKLLDVLNQVEFSSPADFCKIIPQSAGTVFSTRELANAMNLPISLAQRMVYCLRRMKSIEEIGKKGRSILYRTH